MQSVYQRTRDLWTAGLVNTPLLLDSSGKPIMRMRQNGTMTKAQNPSQRFLLFEIDTLDTNVFEEIHDVYVEYDIPYLAHRTARGWHFLTVKALPKEDYWNAIRKIKTFNPDCPMITIRIKPNKWVGEPELFKMKVYHFGNYRCIDQELTQFGDWLYYQKLGLIALKYKVVRYPIDCPFCHNKLHWKDRTYCCTVCTWRLNK